MQGKTCVRCGKFKPFVMYDFSANRTGDGYVRKCKSCLRVQNKKRHKFKKHGKSISFNDFETLSGKRVFR